LKEEKKERDMDEHLLTSLKRDIEERYQRKYGPIPLHFEELTPETDDGVHVQFTISTGTRGVIHYAGTATYLAQHWFLDVQAR